MKQIVISSIYFGLSVAEGMHAGSLSSPFKREGLESCPGTWVVLGVDINAPGTPYPDLTQGPNLFVHN